MTPPLPTLLRWLPAVAWMAMIFFFSHQPGGESGEFSKWVLDQLAGIGLDLRAWFGEHAFVVVRKAAHAFEYFVLCGLLLLALRTWTWPRRGWASWGLASAYACSDEFHQLFIPLRVGDIQDVMIDSLGAALMLGLYALLRWSLGKWRGTQHSVPNQAK